LKRTSTVPVLVDRGVVECVDPRHVGAPVFRLDLGGDAVEGLTGSPGQKHRGSLASERKCHLSSDPPAAP
jgi:hypothetical protein